MSTKVFAPSAWTKQDYIFGPGGEDNELLVSEHYAASWEKIYTGLQCGWPKGLNSWGPETASILAPGYRIRGIVGGLLAIAPDGNPVGGYLGWDIAVSPDHQRKGIGKELVVEYLMRHGNLPLWPGAFFDEGGASYSRLGLATHKAAWRLAQDTVFVAAKRAALMAWPADTPKTAPGFGAGG